MSPRFTASLGGRYTRAEADANRVADPFAPGAVRQLDEDWDDLSGSAQLAFRPVADGPWMLYASLAQAFRAPNLSDLTRLDTARSNELEVPSPGVDPERFLSLELGAKYAGERLSLQAAVFDTEGSDVIIRTPTGRSVGNLVEVTKTNAGESRVRGAELQMAWAIVPELIAFADGVYIDGESDAFPSGPAASPVTEPLDVGMPPSWRAGLRWSSPAQRWRLEGVVEHSDEQDRLSTRDRQDTQRIPPGGTPSFTVLHLRSSWQATASLVFSLAVENLSDTDYRIHGSGVNEPGRNLIASFSWSP
jgi:hemoglobin/transferrin/lactoferrin receptor protein